MSQYPHKGLSVQIILGIGAGLLIGFFFKEQAQSLAPLGRAFIMLLQMPVLIFMFCSIIVGIGSMSLGDAKRIFTYTLIFLAGSYAFTKMSISLIPMALPPIKHIHRFASPESQGSELGLINAFIPENPFKSFADGTVPAVVVFGIFFAVALLRVKNRWPLLKNFASAQEASMVIVGWVTKLSFFGVLAITASSAHQIGHIAFPELKYYYFAFIFGSVFVSVIMLPLLVTVFLPIAYHRLMAPLMPALLLALITGNIVITLPLVLSALSINMKECGFFDGKLQGVTSTLVPLTVNFPVSGKLLNLIFIYFISWHYQDDMQRTEELELSFMGFLTSFGSAEGGVSYLLNTLKLPIDAMALFEASLAITGKFIAFARVASISALCFFTVSSFEHRLTFKPKTLVVGLAVVLISFSSWFFVMGLQKPIDEEQNPFQILTIEQPVKNTIVTDTTSLPSRLAGESSLLEAIRASKILRVGFNVNTKPFAYFNRKGDLVGHDIELAHLLAKDLGVELIFVPFEFGQLATLLNNHTIDIAMSAVSITNERLTQINFSESYARSEHVLVTKDFNLKNFDQKSKIDGKSGVVIAALRGSSFLGQAKARFSSKSIVEIDNYDDFIALGDTSLLYWATPQAAHWTMVNPQFGLIKLPDDMTYDELAFAMPNNAHDFISYINQWLNLQKSNDVLDHLYKKWVLGN
jgi:Na+/H+-dicarboxylate symporter